MREDLRAGNLRSMARTRLDSWAPSVKYQVVNGDIDGLLSAALLHDKFGWKVLGFYDTCDLWLKQGTPRLNLEEVAWVDLDVVWPGARCISQHVVLDRSDDADRIVALADTVNPSLLRGIARCSNYKAKYPFGTFQWVWWLLEEDVERARLDTAVGKGLAWMPDGGAGSLVNAAFQDNCVKWAREILPDSLMDNTLPVVGSSNQLHYSRFGELTCHVMTARNTFALVSGTRGEWTASHQWDMPSRRLTAEAVVSAQRLLNVITGFYGFRTLVLPEQYDIWCGTGIATSDKPRGWPDACNDGRIFSAAAISTRGFKWTSPDGTPKGGCKGTLREILPAASGD